MSLLSDDVVETTEAQDVVAQDVVVRKPSKAGEYMKKQKELLKQRIATVAGYLDNMFENGADLPEDVKDALDGLLKRGKYAKAVREGVQRATNDTFTVLFGDNPQPGDKVSAKDMFDKTHKGFADMRKLMKKWAEKGITVTFDEESYDYTFQGRSA